MWRVLMAVLALAMFAACSQPANAPSEPEKEDLAKAKEDPKQLPVREKIEETTVEETTVTPASTQASASVYGGSEPTSGFDEWNCRGNTYIARQGMNVAEQEAFAKELADRLGDDIEAGGDKKMEDVMNEMGVPAYEDVC